MKKDWVKKKNKTFGIYEKEAIFLTEKKKL